MSIRTATEDDLGTIYDVWLDADGVEERRPGVLPLHAHELRTGTLLVAEHGDEIVGFGAVLERDGLTLLADLFVRRRAQTRGIGRALLAALFGTHTSQVWATMASTDRRARALYRAFGMRERFTNHYLSMTGRWSTPAPLTVCPIAIADELAALDAHLYGRQRRVDLDYWAGLGAVAATFAPGDRSGPVGCSCVRTRPGTRRRRDTGRPDRARDVARRARRGALGPGLLPTPPGRAGMRLTIGARHPALSTRIGAGFIADDFDVFMSSRPDLVDPTRVTLTADLL